MNTQPWFYNSKAWRQVSKFVRETRVLCQRCGAIGCDVDHIRPINSGEYSFNIQHRVPHIDWLDPSKLQLLCRACHRVKSTEDMKTKPSTTYNKKYKI